MGLAWSPDGRVLAISVGEFIRLYETTGYTLIHTLETGVWSPALAFNPAGTHLASGGRDGNVSLWDVVDGRLLFTFPAHKKGVNAVIFSPDGDLLATGGNDAVARLWDPVGGENQGQMIGGTYAVPDIVFTPDGASLAVVNGDVVRLRDVASGRFVQTLRGQESIYTASITADGRLLATGGSQGTVTLWEIESGQAVADYRHDEGSVNLNRRLVWDISFNPDGSRLAAVTGEGVLIVWNLTSGVEEMAFQAHTLAASCIAFSPDGRYLATGGLDGEVWVWQIDP